MLGTVEYHGITVHNHRADRYKQHPAMCAVTFIFHANRRFVPNPTQSIVKLVTTMKKLVWCHDSLVSHGLLTGLSKHTKQAKLIKLLCNYKTYIYLHQIQH